MTKKSIDSLWVFLGLVILLCAQLDVSHGRALREDLSQHVDREFTEIIGKVYFVTSHDSSFSPSAIGSLFSRLASGPSKRGPGH